MLFEPAKKLWGSDYKNLLLNESIIRPVSNDGYVYNDNPGNLALGGGEDYLINNRHLIVCGLNPNRDTEPGADFARDGQNRFQTRLYAAQL